MSETELPAHLPRYCDMCGARMTVTELETRGRQGQALMECSACGHKTGIGWSEGGGEIDGKTPPGEWIFAGESWSPTLKIDEEGHATYELSIHQPMQPPEIPAEAIEVGRELEQIREQFDKYGINALLEAAKFPIFAFVDPWPRLLLRGRASPGGGGWTRGEPPQPALSRVGFSYVGPSYEQPSEGLQIVNTDSKTLPEAITEGGFLDARDAAARLMEVALGLLELRELPGYTITQFVNQKAFYKAEVKRPNIRLRSGEETTWQVRRLTGPVAFAYAGTRISQTSIRIAAVGPIADDLETLLSGLTRLVPGSDEVRALDNASCRDG